MFFKQFYFNISIIYNMIYNNTEVLHKKKKKQKIVLMLKHLKGYNVIKYVYFF